MPINSNTLNTLAYDSISIKENLITRLNSNPDVLKALVYIRQEESDKQHKKWKKKTVDISYFNYISFNPNSSNHVTTLLHTVLQLPVLETTATGLPSTSKETLEKLKTLHTHDVINDLLEYNAIDKIISTFIPALQNSKYKEDGWSYLHGSFNIGGTVSGRLSSSSPNLQNIPSNSKYGKLIKQCFQAPAGKLMVGADFAGLESMISALLTRDPMKEAVFTDGFDSHCLASYFYFKKQMPDITEELQGYFDD